ncbi:MAG TPA: glutaredoxin family protein [Candidatus Binatia bacterium]|nr:glutaredoxin family protein [Candidatus Binatia bacterium]
MKPQLLLYTRKDCCLCQEMKAALGQVAPRVSFLLEEIDVDTSPALQAEYGSDVPVLFINGRKAFKHRLTVRELEKKLKREQNSVAGKILE